MEASSCGPEACTWVCRPAVLDCHLDPKESYVSVRLPCWLHSGLTSSGWLMSQLVCERRHAVDTVGLVILARVCQPSVSMEVSFAIIFHFVSFPLFSWSISRAVENLLEKGVWLLPLAVLWKSDRRSSLSFQLSSSFLLYCFTLQNTCLFSIYHGILFLGELTVVSVLVVFVLRLSELCSSCPLKGSFPGPCFSVRSSIRDICVRERRSPRTGS